MIQSQRVDLVIETRDARMPLTSLNPAFETILDSAGGKGRGLAKRLIVYNKADLAQECFTEVSTTPLTRSLYSFIAYVAVEEGFIAAWRTTNYFYRFEIGRSSQTAPQNRHQYVVAPSYGVGLMTGTVEMADRELEGPDDKISILIAGMPNVGKSSILNALRRVGVSKGTSPLPPFVSSPADVVRRNRKSSLNLLHARPHSSPLHRHQDLSLTPNLHLRHSWNNDTLSREGN